MTLKCLYCSKLLSGKQRKFCCRDHKSTYNNKHLYGYKYTKQYRGRTVENFINHLLNYRGRREFLSIEYLLDLYNKQSGKCAISGVELTYEQGGGKNPTNLSIDRIDPRLGYVPGNVQLVCSIVNTMKLHYSLDSLVSWCQAVIDFQKGKK